MYLCLGSYLALCALAASVGCAPIMQDSQDNAENGHSLITKILNDIPAAHKSWINIASMSLDEVDKFQYLKEQLNFPAAPRLQLISDNFTLHDCLSRISEGLSLHKALLKVIRKKMTSASAEVNELLFDIRDLALLVQKMRTLAPAPAAGAPPVRVISENRLEEDLRPGLSSEYLVKLAAHLTLLQLRQFGQDVSRSFQSMQDGQTPTP
ncbi:colony stimulating factor 3 (granulocyte) a [Electrophorus electricus]|uniref:Interleukin-6 n=1 Tax=Electrophorus electricus TaxID=8005 RepID=A0AAY5ELS9_ELEEL|nr:colony stimulating factor 3 (granulocyte) a [Electrophorus electricus]